ncbi:MAG: energy-coupling factor ABC transporter permease [Armatimonadetes bacterium]|nr:energy-coupling factor ABC transporter permease [Armatimonadota bacterium]
MHIPDGYLSVPVWSAMSAVSAGTVAYSIKRLDKYDEKRIPMLGVMGAFIFAAQMINFPIAGGVSGHLMGSALAAILLGPWAATLVMSAVFIVQCFLFQDGGLTALGANIFNMGIAGTLAGYAVFTLLNRLLPGGKKEAAAAFIAAWLSTVLGAAFTVLELGLSGTVALRAAFIPVVGIYALIGLAEGGITAAALAAVGKARSDLVEHIRPEGSIEHV